MSKNKTTADWLAWVETRFSSASLYYGHGQANAHDEAVQLLFSICQRYDEDLWQQSLNREQRERLQAIVKQRIETRKPLAYLTHEAWFMGMPFYVDERVLIPRSPFAEWIDYQFSPWLRAERVRHLLEIGTGSGCMAIACASVFEDAIVDAVDISEAALEVANINVERYQLQQRVRLIHSDAFAKVTRNDYDLIISNPPYVGDAEMQSLPAEYQYEPIQTALHSGKDGLDLPKRILVEAADYLNEEGVLVMEVGNNAAYLQQRFASVPFTWLEQSIGGHGLLMLTYQTLQDCAEALRGR